MQRRVGGGRVIIDSEHSNAVATGEFVSRQVSGTRDAPGAGRQAPRARKAGKDGTGTPLAVESFRQSEHIGRLLYGGHRLFERLAISNLRNLGFADLRLSHLVLIRDLPLTGRRTTEIAEASSMTKQAVGQLAIELERAGYVKRLTDPTDGRAKIVKYTNRGEGLVAIIPKVLRTTEGEIEAMIGRSAFRELRRGLLKLAAKAAVETREPSQAQDD